MNSDTVDADTLRISTTCTWCTRGRPDSTCTRCTSPAAVRLCEAGGGPARTAVREFSALPDGLRAMTDWLRAHGVTAARDGGYRGSTGKAPFEALEDAGIHADLLHAQHVKQIRGKKTDTNDSLWLARICQFGLALPSYVPPRLFRQLRQLTRYRRKLVAERSRNRNRVHKTLDHDGPAARRHLVRHLRRQRTAHPRRAGRRAPAGRHSGRPDESCAGPSWSRSPPPGPLAAARPRPPSRWSCCKCRWPTSTGVDNRSLAALDSRIHAPRWSTISATLRLLQTIPGGHRFRQCMHHPCRNRTGPGGLPGGAPPRRLGRRCAGQQHQRRQAPRREGAQGEPDATGHACRMRSRRRPNQELAILRVSPDTRRPPRLQAGHPRYRPQAVARLTRRPAR